MRRVRKAIVSLLGVGMLLAATPSSAGAGAGGGTTIRAVVVKSWSLCDSWYVIWDTLNSSWQDYGSVPIEIDYSYPGLCDGSRVDYQTLVDSGADVVILSDPAGGLQAFSQDEIKALSRYAREGHNVIGTYLAFSWRGFHNPGLAPLVGIDEATRYGPSVSVTPAYDELEPDNSLFRNIPDPYVSSGLPVSQVPSDGLWDAGELAGARYVGKTSDSKAAILVAQKPTYTGIYISTMPEYVGGTQDLQFFYNAITYGAN